METLQRRNRKENEKQFWSRYPYIILAIFAIVLTAISYVPINTNSQIYDYPFHMARIVGLAQSIANGDWLPNLNYLFTHGSGYAVPMFYGNGILYLPALVYLVTKVGTLAYTTYAFIIILATTCTSYYSLFQMTGDKAKAILFGMTMATVFPYFGFGMTAAVPFIPILIYCIYKVLFMERLNPILLGVTVSLLVQTHVISTLVLAISSAIIVLFNIHRFTWRKLFSFLISVAIALSLSIGYILQYLEQNRSQTFFVSWGLRDYPFPSPTILAAGSLFQLLKNYFFPLALVFLVLGFILIKYVKPLSRTLLFTSLVLLIAASDILPWQSILRFTFLTVFQYTTRLIYFLPAFILMALFLADIKYLAKVLAVVQIGFYILTGPLSFLPNATNYKERYGLLATNIEVMRAQNAQATNAYTHPTITTYWSSGSEYFNLTIDHKHVEDGTINQFIYDQSLVEITNVQQGYNHLEFDISLSNEGTEALVVLPRIWYKGYVAEYSNGADGTQPEISYVSLTEEELKQYKEAHKPAVKTKALYDGRATINVTKSGHVSIRYKKTNIQWIGFMLECFFWISLLSFSIIMYVKEKKKSL